MRVSLRFVLGLLFLGNWVQCVQAHDNHQLEVFSPMPPVLTASGVYSGKDLISTSEDDSIEAPSTLHIPIMDYSFGNSYGKPYVTDFPSIKPPFEAVWLNVTIRIKGHQFDRLGTIWIDDTEIMRLSTPEPTDQGVVSYIVKDLTQYAAIFKGAPKRFIFDMGNLVNDIYTAPIHITVDAYFYQPKKADALPVAAHRIIPISAARASSESKPSTWNFPSEKAEAKFRISKNTTRAVLTVAATGQGAEEFWWSNVPESAATYFGEHNRLPGMSSFREVRVYIDEREAGYAWPFPVVFTGGVSPSLHRPVAGIQTFDLRESEIDLTPWLGLLCDGKEHVMRLEVWGVDDSKPEGSVFKQAGDHWLLSGKIFVWEAEKEAEETDEEETYESEENIWETNKPDNDKKLGKSRNKPEENDSKFGKSDKSFWGANKRVEPDEQVPEVSSHPINYKATVKPLEDGSFHYSQTITRKIVSEAHDIKRDGSYDVSEKKGDVVRSTQEYHMQNSGVYRNYAQTQEVQSKYTGGSQSIHRGEKNLATRFTYDIGSTASYKTTPEVPLELEAKLSQSLKLEVTNHSPLVEGARDIVRYWEDSAGTIINTRKDGDSKFTQKSDGTSEGWGSTSQHYTVSAMKPLGKDHFGPPGDEWYRREVEYKDIYPILDKQYFLGKEVLSGFEPVERTISHQPSDYAPYPLVRSGVPNIYLRDRLAVESSTGFKVQSSQGGFSRLELE